VQDFALGLVELFDVHTGSLLKPAKVIMDGIPTLKHLICTTQLNVIHKLAEDALSPTIYVINKDIQTLL